MSVASKKKIADEEELPDYSLNDVLLRGRVSAKAVEKELPIIEKDVVEMKLSVSEALLKLIALNKI